MNKYINRNTNKQTLKKRSRYISSIINEYKWRKKTKLKWKLSGFFLPSFFVIVRRLQLFLLSLLLLVFTLILCARIINNDFKDFRKNETVSASLHFTQTDLLFKNTFDGIMSKYWGEKKKNPQASQYLHTFPLPLSFCGNWNTT